MKSKHAPKGFTLIELLIAISIFSVVILVASSIFTDALRLDRKSSLQQQIYDDARFTLDKIAQAVQSGTIDYEEYFNQIVLGGKYGENFGAYNTRFYYPGTILPLTGGPRAGELVVYGAACNDQRSKKIPGNDCTVLKKTVDKNTGQNPYRGGDGADTSEAVLANNAVCMTVDNPAADGSRATGLSTGRCAVGDNNKFDELYIINRDGTRKTIFLRESIKANPNDQDVFAVSFLEMTGKDSDGDGIADAFSCAGEFECRGTAPNGTDKIPDAADKNDVGSPDDTSQNGFSKDFVPISPTRVTVTDLRFFISPLEDPHRAFAEEDASIQKLPHVTIFMTVSPNKNVIASAEDFSLTLEETVSTKLLEPVPAPVIGQY